MFLPGHEAAVQVNQSAAGFPQLLARLPESCQRPMTTRIEAEPIIELLREWERRRVTGSLKKVGVSDVAHDSAPHRHAMEVE